MQGSREDVGDGSTFAQLLEFAPDAIVGVDSDGLIVLANHQTATLFGYGADELVGRPVELLVPARFQAAHPAHRRSYFADPKSRPMGAGLKLAGRRKDGSEFPAEISLSSLDADGRRLALVAVRDVTERQAADQAQARLAAIVDSSSDAIVGHSREGQITSWNRAAEQLYGYPAADAIGRSISMLQWGAAADALGPPETVEARDQDAQHLRKDGTRIEVVLTVSAVRGQRGEDLGMATIVRDVSAQRRAQRTFEGLLEFAPDAIVGIQADGRISLVNRQAEVLFGYDRDELIGALVEQLVPGRFVAGHAAHREGYFADPLTRPMGAGTELAGRRKDGSEFPAEISLSSLETDGGVIAVAAVRDISERAESERERTLQAELNQSRRLESVGQLAGGIAHDFNNLLGVILNLTEFVAEAVPDDSQARADLDEIGRAAERAAALTRQLLIFSRREQVQLQVIDVGELTRGVENLLRRALGERVQLEVAPAEGLWNVEADRGQLEQVLVNLAVNGRDAMPTGGTLLIETSNVWLDEDFSAAHVEIEPGPYVRLTVSDSGVGMEPEVIERAFEPFYTTKPKGQGTGLGLATVYGIVKEAGGHVTLYSEPGVGTSVKIHLPATQQGVQARADAPLPSAAGRGEAILVVEDEPAVRAVAERVLRQSGYRVFTAADGNEALALAAREPIDLVLTDVIMPGMVGPDLVEILRRDQPELKVIFMSGYSHKVLASATLQESEHSAFVEKPFAARRLREVVRSLLDRG